MNHNLATVDKIKEGSLVEIDSVDHSGKTFLVSQIQNYFTKVGTETFSMTDYHLVDRSDDSKFVLRTIPHEGSFHALILTQFDTFGWISEFETAVNDESGQLRINGEENLFNRIGGIQLPYHARVVCAVNEHETVAKREYWDYSRESIIDGIPTHEFVYVEKESNTGWFTIYRGVEVDASRISTF